MSESAYPKLSQTLDGPRDPHRCQRCGREGFIGFCPVDRAFTILHAWEECDDEDRGSGRYVVLCRPCGERIIEPHPRLYRRLEINEPALGVMKMCEACKWRDGTYCSHRARKCNGGEGLLITLPQPRPCFVDYSRKDRKRQGHSIMTYPGPAISCAGRNVDEEPA